MSTSAKKIAANRLNGQKSPGPSNTTSTRYNATKHGLLAKGVTELDDAEGYNTLLKSLSIEKNPAGPIKVFLVESIALDMVRARRARRLEAEFITSLLNPPILGPSPLGTDEMFLPEIVDPGLPASIDAEPAQKLVGTFQRYESAISTRMVRAMHELERLQRMRKGEALPAPAAIDVNVFATTKMGGSSQGLSQTDADPEEIMERR